MLSKVSPKDVFLHLLVIIALYASAVGLLVLLFQYVNLAFPDPALEGATYTREGYFSSIRFSVSSLVVVFPVFLFTSWFLNKGYNRTPSKRNLKIRKWLVYFTIFAAALVIIGDLITLIYNFLGGELTVRFILKVLAVFFVAGSIFTYYFWDVRKYKTE